MRGSSLSLLALTFITAPACNDTISYEEPDTVTGMSAIELLECQESGDACPSAEDPSLLCCAIAAESGCDCFSIGGTMGEGGTCSAVCDGGAGGRVQDENGCWYWETPSADGCTMIDAGAADVGLIDSR